MILALLLVFGFTVLGLPIRKMLSPSSELAFAPTFGLAAIVFLSYLLSANLGLGGADSAAISMIFWAFIALGWTVAMLAKKPASRWTVNLDGWIWILATVPGFLLLIPAMLYGVEKFFGAVNFDFFYNSRDARYLAEHSVLEFTAKTDEILPFIWSSDQQGRFGINLLTAAFVKFLDWNAVRVNASIITALILVNCLGIFALCRSVYKVKKTHSVIFTCFVTLSAGFAQGYYYYLLGQISALPLFSLAIASSVNVVRSSTEKISSKRPIVLMMFLLNALYIFYAILSVFAAVILGAALVFSTVARRENAQRLLKNSFLLAFGTLGLFVLIRLLSLDALVQSVSSWISLSLQTAAADTAKPAIFSEYVLEPVLLLVFGVTSYPSGQSIISQAVGFGANRGVLLLILSFLTLASFVAALAVCLKDERLSWPERSVLSSLSVITLAGTFAFFLTGSGYSLFKIANWLVPYLLPVFMFPIFAILLKPTYMRGVTVALSTIILAANVSSAVVYSSPFWLLPGEKGVNAKSVNGLPGVEELKAALRPYPNSDLFFDLKNGIRNAWIANELSDHNLHAVTNNFQPLTDRVLPNPVCNDNERLRDNGILIADTENKDIVANDISSKSFFKGTPYSATRISELDQYLYFGRGSYLVESGDNRDIAAGGLPSSFRWVERGVELYYFTRKGGLVDLSFLAVPGYADGPAVRTLTIKSANHLEKMHFSRKAPRIIVNTLQVVAGLNCFYIESPDLVTIPARYGGLLRSGTQIDFRLLNFAVADVSVTEAH